MATYKKSGAPRHSSSNRRIVVVVVPPVDELDLVGPLQVFNSVNRLAGRKIYAIEVVTNAERLIVEGEGGVLTFMAKDHFNKVEGACDSVLLVCGLGTRSVRDAALSTWLKKMAAEVRRLGAVCVGAFLLAEAGLLNDRRATTHWRFGREMATRYPGVRVQHDPLWVKDGNIYTSAGISAGIDLALAWVEEDCGAALAHEAARELVLFLRRPGRTTAAERLARVAGIRDVVDSRAADLDGRASRNEALGRGSRGPDVDERAKLRACVHARGWHDAFAVRAADARRGGAASARADRGRTQTCRLGGWIRQRRRDAARVRPAAGNHTAPLSRPRRSGVLIRRMRKVSACSRDQPLL